MALAVFSGSEKIFPGLEKIFSGLENSRLAFSNQKQLLHDAPFTLYPRSLLRQPLQLLQLLLNDRSRYDTPTLCARPL